MTTPNPRDAADFDRLVSAYFDGQIGEAEFAELQSRLRSDSSARSRYLELAAVHGGLAWVCATQPQQQADSAAATRGESAATRGESAATRGVSHFPTVAESVAKPPPLSLARSVGWRLVLTAAAAGLVAAVVLPLSDVIGPRMPQPTEPELLTPRAAGPSEPIRSNPSSPQTSPNAVASARRARLVEHAGVVEILSPNEPSVRATLSGELPLSLGQSVHTGGDNSYAVLAFEDGTRLELSVATTVRLASSASSAASAPATAAAEPLFLSAGTVRVQSQQPPVSGLQLETPHAQLRVNASTFTCSVGESATRLEMDSDSVGQAQLVRRADGRAVELRPGDYVVSGMEPTSELAPRPLVPTDVLIPHSSIRLSGPALALSADGARLATGLKGQVALWSTRTGLVEFTLDTGRDRVRQLHFSGDGRSLATLSTLPGEGESPIQQWDLLQRRMMRSLREPASPWLQTLALSPDGRTLITTEHPHESNGRVGRLFWWSTASGESLHTVELPRGHRATTLAFAPDGRRLAMAATDGSLTLYDARTARVLARLRTSLRKSDRVESVAFSTDGTLVAATAANGAELRLWDLGDRLDRADMISFSAQGRRFRSVAVSAMDGHLAAGSVDGNLCLWDLRTGQEILTSRLSNRSVPLVAFSPDGRTLTAVSESGMVRTWQLTVPAKR